MKGLPGRRLSARRRRPCQTTAFCRHSNTRCQSDAQQFWRQDLCRCRTTSLEQSASQSQTLWVSHGQFRRLLKTFSSDTETTAQGELVLTAPNRNILTYLRRGSWYIVITLGVRKINLFGTLRHTATDPNIHLADMDRSRGDNV